MIIVKLQGGLGNQMFQYALGRALEIKNKAKVKFDISWYATQDYRVHELLDFNVKEDIATEKEVKHFMKYRKKVRKILFWYNLFIANENKYVREKGYSFSPNILEIKDDAYLDGIWQTQKYFMDIKDVIQKEFTLKKPLHPSTVEIQKKMRDTESVSICIRRGDFVNNTKVNNVHGLLPMDFYYETVKVISQKVKDPTFFVFSDDSDWVRDNFKIDFPCVFVSDGHKNIPSSAELTLMSMCKHNINANSTFSWWASWLNKNPNKIILGPEKWFKMENRNHADLVPDSWISVPNTHV